MTAEGKKSTLAEIEKRAQHYAKAREQVAERIQRLQEEIERVKRRQLAGIRRAVAAAAEAHDRLWAVIEESPDRFERPRTLVIAGIRVGYAKGAGKLCFEDAAQVVRLIRRHFPEQIDTLVKVEEKPIRKALANLSVAELKRLGVRVEETGDRVVIRPTDSEVDKLVEALLADAERLEEVA